MLLDEPFAALDAITRLKMHDLVRALRVRHDSTMLLVTHDVDESISLGDRILVMRDGRIASEHPVELDLARRARGPAATGSAPSCSPSSDSTVAHERAHPDPTERARRARRHYPTRREHGSKQQAPGSGPHAWRRGLVIGIAAIAARLDARTSASKPTFVVGQQESGIVSLFKQSGALNGAAYNVKFAVFPFGPPQVQAAAAGQIDIG